MMNQQVKVSVRMFEAWQIGADYHTWCGLGRPGRFGQWFLNYHHIEGHQNVFYETNDRVAKELILKMEL
jgi:hypothetical protein